MGLADHLDTAAIVVVLASLVVGFWEASQNIGEVTQILDQAISEPTKFLPGLVLWSVSMDIWTPGLPVSLLPGWLRWIGVFYPFSSPYLPHFSIWTCASALIFSAIITYIVIHVLDWDFWWHGLLLAVVMFIVSWYVTTLIAWWGIGHGASMMGLSKESAYEIWRSAVSATSPPVLQYFFILCVPLSVYLIARKLGSRLM